MSTQPFNYGFDGTDEILNQTLPDGYEFRKSNNNDLQVWKVDITPNVLITSQNVGEFDVNGSLRAAVNTVYLEEAHSISSSGEEVTFKNLETKVHYTPLWGFTSENGSIVGKAAALEEGELTEIDTNGALNLSFTIPCVSNYPIVTNRSIYSYSVKSAEEYSGKLYLEVLNNIGERVFASEQVVTLVDGSDIIFDKILYRVRVGNVRTVKIVKADGTPINVYAGVTSITEPYAHIMCREFVDREVVTLGSDGKIPIDKLPTLDSIDRYVVANQAERLAITPSDKFIIAIQTDIGHEFLLENGLNPSILSNWVDVGSIVSAVVDFNGRTGSITPQVGDYTAAQVGAVAIPSNDGSRRVFIGSTPTTELIIDNLTSTSTNNPLSAAQGKILQDNKQDKLNGLSVHRFIQVSNATNSTTTSSNINTTTILPLLGDGSFNDSFNNPTGYGSLDTVNNWINISNINRNANLMCRVTMTNNQGGNVSDATLVMRLIPDINNPSVFNDITNVPETFSTQAAFMIMAFHGGVDAVQIGIRTSSIEHVRLNGVYLTISEPILIN